MANLWVTDSYLPPADRSGRSLLALVSGYHLPFTGCHCGALPIHRCQIASDLVPLSSENPAAHPVIAVANFHQITIHLWSVSCLPGSHILHRLVLHDERLREQRHNHNDELTERSVRRRRLSYRFTLKVWRLLWSYLEERFQCDAELVAHELYVHSQCTLGYHSIINILVYLSLKDDKWCMAVLCT